MTKFTFSVLAGMLVASMGCLVLDSTDTLEPEEERRATVPGAVEQISISGSFESVFLDACEACRPEVTVRGTSEAVARTTNTLQEDGTLVLSSRGRDFQHGRVEVIVRSPVLHALTVSGDAFVEVNSAHPERFAVTTSGLAQVTLKGRVADMSYTVSGSAEIDALELQSDRSEILISGSATIDVCVVDTLDVVISGTGEVTYACGPRSVQERISGTGVVRAR